MRKLNLCVLAILISLSSGVSGYGAVAAKTKVTHKRSDYTPQQREKLMEEVRKICKARYGAGSTVYQFDYYKWRVTCLEG